MERTLQCKTEVVTNPLHGGVLLSKPPDLQIGRGLPPLKFKSFAGIATHWIPDIETKSEPHARGAILVDFDPHEVEIVSH
ncbi:MAG: hypothetical protein WB650_02155 [Candidatus Binatus sp.]